jgi:hypothetical protein
MSKSQRVLLGASITSAFLPFLLFERFVHFNLPLIGGVLLNPMNIAAYLWLGLTITYCSRWHTKTSLWLFIAFPIAFALPVIGLLFRIAWETQSFGH